MFPEGQHCLHVLLEATDKCTHLDERTQIAGTVVERKKYFKLKKSLFKCFCSESLQFASIWGSHILLFYWHMTHLKVSDLGSVFLCAFAQVVEVIVFI